MNIGFPNPHRFRAIWISDIHLGTRRAQTALLLDFLRATDSNALYIVGDLIDNWSLGKDWYWDQLHNDVIQKILRKARKGTKVVYIPGNHDEHFRDFDNLRFGRVSIRREAKHVCADGRRYLVLHATSSTASSAMQSGSPVSATGPTIGRCASTAFSTACAVPSVCPTGRSPPISSAR